PEDGWRRDDLMAWLAAAPILENPGSPAVAPAAAWDALSRRAGVVAGSAQWDGRLAAHRVRLDEERQAILSAHADEDEDGGPLARLVHELRRTDQLRSFVAELVEVAEP